MSGEFQHTCQEEIPILHELFQKIEKEGTLPSLYKNQIKILQENKTKPQTNIRHEHRHKHPLKIIIKLNPVIYEKRIIHDSQMECIQGE